MVRLLVVGSMNADVFLQVPRLPLVGETISAHPEARVFPGGKGANTAVCAARLLPAAADGSQQQQQEAQHSVVRFACQLGSDGHYAVLMSTLRAAGVEASLVRQVPGSTGAAFILLQPGGDNSIVLAGGANQAWTLPLPPQLQQAVTQADCVLLQREIPDAVNDAVAAALDAAEAEDGARRQRRVLLDVGGSCSPLSPALLRHVLWLAPNETELSGLTGLPTDSEAAMLDAARALLSALSSDGLGLLLTAGRGGSFLLVPQPQPQPPLCIHCPAYQVDVVDSTGAGDAFRAAFCVSYWSLPAASRSSSAALLDCLRFASATAALCCQTHGCIPAMPTRAQVMEFVQQRAERKAATDSSSSHSEL